MLIEWLDKYYPKDTKKEITNLEIVSRRLESELNLVEFTNLAELTIITEPKRNWEDFYNWLNTNIVDINAKGDDKGNIKEVKRS